MARLLKLEKMEVLGFKSFYGRTLFEFPAGITGVVGPNGCGKSNIGDAISWVLGEQKASSLRSDRMEDVIFNGSEARKPLGMAEVSLYLKNVLGGNGNGGNGHAGVPAPEIADEAIALAAPVGGDVPVPIATVQEFAGEAGDPPSFRLEDLPEEVVVTRRLYRSGESEYILNGRRCRLKDIQDLLSRTQIGSRLYTTIEQGKIDQILSAKPKDRRTILEEAAGILGYRLKRRHAEQKLDAAQANLLRLSDIIGEVEKQIQSLKRQAAKARRYRRLLEALRDKRLHLAGRRLRAIDADRAATHEALAQLREREAAAASDTARAEADREEIRLRLEAGEEASRRRREEIHARDREIDRLQSQRRTGEEQARDLEGRVADAGREIEALAARIADHEQGLAGLEADLASESDRARELGETLARAGAVLEERTREIAALEAAVAAARGHLMEMLDGNAAVTRSGAAVEERLRAARQALERAELEEAEARAAGEALGVAIAGLQAQGETARSARAEAERERERAAGEERETAGRLGVLERRAEELRGRADALAERLAALQELERHHAGFAEGVAAVLDGAAGFAPSGVVGEAIRVPRGLERAVGAALEGWVEAVLVGTVNDALAGIDHLRRTAGGRISFVPAAGVAAGSRPALPPEAAALPGVEGILLDRVGQVAPGGPVEAVLARTLLVSDLTRALQGRDLLPGWHCVTRDGDILRAEGIVTGGDGQALQHGVLGRRAEMTEVTEQIEEVERLRTDLASAIPACRAALEDVRARLLSAAAAVQEADRRVLETGLLLMQRQAEAQKIDAGLPLLRSEMERLRRDIDERAAEAGRLAAEGAAAGDRRRSLEESIGAQAEALATGRAALLQAERHAAEARAAVAAQQERRVSLERERASLFGSIEEMRGRSTSRGGEREEWSARVRSLRQEDAVVAGAIERALAARAEEAARDEASAAGLAYDRSLLHAREQAGKEGRAAHEQVRRDLQDRELHLARLDADLGYLDRSCRDDLGTTLETLRSAPPAPEERPLEDEERDLSALRADLDAVGPVNLMAIEQYTELEERFNFLLAQKQDLDDSIAALRETIRRIDRESRERFLAAFQAVQAGFQQAFVTLFGGGRAEIRLQDDDVLEAGIEIVAQPPGKRLQSIALLSGGERALTAVALLFSLFRYRPSPFCVLDEVDAPLDEANVERFTRLLRELREETQFILITHNRKSMEAADLLYGVTMEEPGVSKVLPLRLE